MKNPLRDVDTSTAIGVFVLTLTLGTVVLVASLLLPSVGAYYIGDLVQDESYATVQIDENSTEIRITATNMLNAEEIHIRGDGIDSAHEDTRLTASGQTLVIKDRSDVLSGELTAGDSIQLVILVAEDDGLREAQTRGYELEYTYQPSEENTGSS